jgi:hypothetical protein
VTTRERVTALERAVPASRAVLYWFTRANKSRSILAYVRSCLEQDDPNADFARIHAHVVRAASHAQRIQPPRERGRAISVALRDAAFAYQLILVLNATMNHFADRARLRSLLLVGEMGRLIDHASDEPNPSQDQTGSAEHPDAGWQRWRESVEAFVDDVCVEGQAGPRSMTGTSRVATSCSARSWSSGPR